MAVPKRVRLQELYRRLAAAPFASTYEEARGQHSNILNEVEDALTGIPYDLSRWETDGRMYPPQDDNLRKVPGQPHVRRFRHFGHNTYIGDNGSIEITRLDGTVEFQKYGADGRGVWELDDE
jgi:hypothetical protein